MVADVRETLSVSKRALKKFCMERFFAALENLDGGEKRAKFLKSSKFERLLM
jgi:hypothetical protein